jgi:hypothetical protein
MQRTCHSALVKPAHGKYQEFAAEEIFMGSDWVTAAQVVVAGAFGGFIYWGSTLVFTRLRAMIRAR